MKEYKTLEEIQKDYPLDKNMVYLVWANDEVIELTPFELYTYYATDGDRYYLMQKCNGNFAILSKDPREAIKGFNCDLKNYNIKEFGYAFGNLKEAEHWKEKLSKEIKNAN